ncbi:MAG: nucleotidyltransferase family protein, partial [Clostridia bacterium]|nr:nucleotidyltransferase family protein [Clostridia bacterium]
PNDILGIEYLRAIKSLGAKLTPYTVKRIGSYKGGEGGFASASKIRENHAKSGIGALCGDLPSAALEVYEKASAKKLFGTDYERLASAVMLEFMSDGKEVAFSGGGLYNHLQKHALTQGKIDGLLYAASRSRYTISEVSRCILYTLLHVKPCDLEGDVLYTRLFAANEKGREILNKIKDIEVVTKPSATEKLSEAARAQYEKTFYAERAFALCFDGEYEFTKQAPRIK